MSRYRPVLSPGFPYLILNNRTLKQEIISNGYKVAKSYNDNVATGAIDPAVTSLDQFKADAQASGSEGSEVVKTQGYGDGRDTHTNARRHMNR